MTDDGLAQAPLSECSGHSATIETSHLFVYGTLRSGSGHPMPQWLAARARLIGPVTVQARLYSLGPYSGIVLSGDPGDVVRGEVYHLHEPVALFDTLDQYEGDGFERAQAEALVGDSTIVSWVYVCRDQPSCSC